MVRASCSINKNTNPTPNCISQKTSSTKSFVTFACYLMEEEIKAVEREYNQKINRVTNELMHREVQSIATEYNQKINGVLKELQRREEDELDQEYTKKIAEIDALIEQAC